MYDTQPSTDLLDLVASYREYAVADEFAAMNEAPAATPTALFSIATSKWFVSTAVSGAGAGATYRVGC